MTILELMEIVQVSSSTISDQIHLLAPQSQSLQRIISNGVIIRNSHLSKPDCIKIMDNLKSPRIAYKLLEERFKKMQNSDYYKLDGTTEYLEKFKEETPRCCNSCIHLCGNKLYTTQPQPFCKLYDTFLSKLGLKVYNDYCPYYECSNCDRPIIWYKEFAPANLDKYGDVVPRNKKQAPRKEPASPLCGFFNLEDLRM